MRPRPSSPRVRTTPPVLSGSGTYRPQSSVQCCSSMWQASHGILISRKLCWSDAKATSTMAWSLSGIPSRKAPDLLISPETCLALRQAPGRGRCGLRSTLRLFSSRTPKITNLHVLARRTMARLRGVNPSSLDRYFQPGHAGNVKNRLFILSRRLGPDPKYRTWKKTMTTASWRIPLCTSGNRRGRHHRRFIAQAF